MTATATEYRVVARWSKGKRMIELRHSQNAPCYGYMFVGAGVQWTLGTWHSRTGQWTDASAIACGDRQYTQLTREGADA